MTRARLALLVGMTFLSALACASQGGGDAEPGTAQAGHGEEPMKEDQEAPSAQPKGEEAVLVGVVHRDGVKACPENAADIEFHALFWSVGFTPLVLDGVTEAAVEAQHGKVALVRGRVADRGPEKEPLPEGYSPANCPIPQMRSDMIESPDGMRFDRGHRLGLAGFAAAAVEPFSGLRVTRDGDSLDLRLENTLGKALEGPVELVLHYEGCYGKPGSQVRSLAEKDGLAPGETLEGRLPAILAGEVDAPPRKGGNPRRYAAFMIELRGRGDGVYLDFDARLSELGADPVSCDE